MDKIRGLRPKNGGIEIRFGRKGKMYSSILNKPYNRTNCAEAARLRKQLIESVDSAAAADHLRPDNPTFQEVAQEFLDATRARCAQSYTNQVKRDLNNIWSPLLGTMRIKDIRIRDVRLADQSRDWPSAKRQQNSRTILRSVFNLAVIDELIDANPAEKLVAVKHQAPDIDPFNFNEKTAILNNLTGQSHLYFLLAFETGLRSAELLGLLHTDFRDEHIYLARTMVLKTIKGMKTKQCRYVALTSQAKKAMESYEHPNTGWLWSNNRGSRLLDCNQLCRDWRAALLSAGVRHRRSYTCRHTRASLGLSAGQTPAWLAKQLGHDMRTFFAKYATYIDGGNDAAELAKLGY
jgi:integrase